MLYVSLQEADGKKLLFSLLSNTRQNWCDLRTFPRSVIWEMPYPAVSMGNYWDPVEKGCCSLSFYSETVVIGRRPSVSHAAVVIYRRRYALFKHVSSKEQSALPVAAMQGRRLTECNERKNKQPFDWPMWKYTKLLMPRQLFCWLS